MGRSFHFQRSYRRKVFVPGLKSASFCIYETTITVFHQISDAKKKKGEESPFLRFKRNELTAQHIHVEGEYGDFFPAMERNWFQIII